MAVKRPTKTKKTKRASPKNNSRSKKQPLIRTTVSRNVKKTFPVSINVPQIENLLSELEYGEELAEYYDLIYSEKVIHQIQSPFFQMLIKRYGIRSACDLSCRSGQTLAALSKLGIKNLAGVDVSSKMLDLARKRCPSKTQFYQSELFLAPHTIGDETKFDLVLCSRDALPLVLDDESLLGFMAQARNLLSPNGILVVETWNYDKIWRRKERFMPVMDRCSNKQSLLFFIENDFHGELLVHNVVKLEKNKFEWFLRTISTPIRPLTRNEMEFFVKEAGFEKYGFLGNYAGSPFNTAESAYCIMLAMNNTNTITVS